MITIRNPNGYGTIVKLSGNRRKPYAARKTVGVTEHGYPKQKNIGYFATLREAKKFLAEYNAGLVNIDTTTLGSVWQAYYDRIQNTKAGGTIKNELSFYQRCYERFSERSFYDIKPMEIQAVIDEQSPTSKDQAKGLWKNLEKQALFMDIPCKRFGDSLSATRQEPKEKKVFSEQEIADLKKKADDPIIADALILIYTGMRIAEYLGLQKTDIKDGIITCGVKTENGKNRRIPIHPYILPLIEEKCLKSPSAFVVGGDYHPLLRAWRKRPELKPYTFHECRHTFRTRLDNAGANPKCMDLLLGHKGEYVGERVYNHKTISDLIATVNLLQ